jgi:hypothetical protein
MLLNLREMSSFARPGTSTPNTGSGYDSCSHFDLIDAREIYLFSIFTQFATFPA